MDPAESKMIDYRYVTVNNVRLHLAEAGPRNGPLLFLLHGFPEYWYAWRDIIEPLAQAGYHVIAPDQRGYNLSDKPKGAENYTLDLLASDIVEIARERGATTFDVVGHDWGASVGWWLATRYPQHLNNLIALNAPHPAVWTRAMHDTDQRPLSRYVQMLRHKWWPEFFIRLGKYKALEKAFESASSHAFPRGTMRQYREAWRRPGALTAMLNWYRALFIQRIVHPPRQSIRVPVLLLWGDRDPYAVPRLARRSANLCRISTLKQFPDHGHWLPHEDPELVLKEILAFLAIERSIDDRRSHFAR